MTLKLVIPRQNGRLAVLLPWGELWEQVVDPADYRGERTVWAAVDTSSLPKHLAIVSAHDREDQKLVVQLEDGSLWAQQRDPDFTSGVKYRFAPIDLAGLPTVAPKPKRPDPKQLDDHLGITPLPPRAGHMH